MDVLRKERKNTAHQEGRDSCGGIGLLKRAGEVGEMPGDVAGNTCGDAAGIERKRIEPDGSQAIADGRLLDFIERDAVGKGIGKGNVGLAHAGKIGKDLDGVANIDNDEEGGPAFGGGEGLGVLLRLVTSAEHSFVPASSAADGGPATAGHFEKEGRLGRGATLLGFQDEASVLVEVDEAGTR